VYVKSHLTFRVVLADLPDGMADRELLVVTLRELESTPDSQSLSPRQGLLDKSLAGIDGILQHQRKCNPGYARLTVSLQAAPHATPSAQNAFARIR
jgi:hypothetical protein